MNYTRAILLLVASFFLSACAQKQYVKQDSAFIIFKTPTFKYADMGFIYENAEELKVDIYGNGQALVSLKISENSVCMSFLKCMSRSEFNKKILNSVYPDNMLDDIFRGKPIFNGANLIQNRNSFTQSIINKNKYNIEYTVLNNEIVFSDTINDILITIKRMQ